MIRKDLVNKLSKVKPCLGSDGFVPILTHFCFDKKRIVAGNGTQSIAVAFESDLNCAVPGDLLYKLLSSFKDKSVKITEKTGKVNKVHIKTAGSSSHLGTLPADDFVIPEWDKDECDTIKVDAEFIKGIQQCFFSCSINPLLENQYGITLIISEKGSMMYATDGQRISSYDMPGFKGKAKSIFLPRVFCELIVGLGETEGTLCIGKNYILLDFGTAQVYSQLPADLEFIDFDEVIKSYYNGETLYDAPPALSDAVNRNLILTSSDTDHMINIVTDGKNIELTSQSGHGIVRDEVEFPEDFDLLNFTMDGIYLKDALSAVDTMSFVPVAAGVLFVGKKDNFLHLFSALAKSASEDD
ncbi:MAG: hypothetical protein KAR06_00380 [Deltaproteobacteria bacterium]|nr:hypothetical protein [Deltaproteobacteria bacterium]